MAGLPGGGRPMLAEVPGPRHLSGGGQGSANSREAQRLLQEPTPPGRVDSRAPRGCPDPSTHIEPGDSMRLRDVSAIAFVVALALPSYAAAPAPAAQRSAFTIARLKYGGGGDWYGDQGSLRNLLQGLRDKAGVPVGVDDAPVVSPTDEALFNYPMVFMAGHGNVKFTPAEVERLRRYL